MTAPVGTIVPINTAVLIARILEYKERLAADAIEAGEGTEGWIKNVAAATAVYNVAQLVAQAITGAHLASLPPGEKQ